MGEMRSEQTVVRRDNTSARKNHNSGGLSMWSVVGGAALVALAAAVIVNLSDIKRYIKISTM